MKTRRRAVSGEPGTGRTPFPEWAVERLSGKGDALRLLGSLVGELHAQRQAARFDDADLRIAVRDQIRKGWSEVALRPLRQLPQWEREQIRMAFGVFGATTLVKEMLARTLPLVSGFDEDTPAHAHLQGAVSYLEAAMAIETAMARPAMSTTRSQLHMERVLRDEAVNRYMRDAWDGLKHASTGVLDRIWGDVVVTGEGRDGRPRPLPRVLQRIPFSSPPLGPPPPGEDRVRVPSLSDVWAHHLKGPIREALTGLHGLWFKEAEIRIEDGRAHFEATLSRGATRLLVTASYVSGEQKPVISYAIGRPGSYDSIKPADVHQALHRDNADPASLRVASAIALAVPEAGEFAFGATGPYAIMVAPPPGSPDPERFARILRRAEELAEPEGVTVEVELDGILVGLSEMGKRGYEPVVRVGGIVMVRRPAPSNIHAYDGFEASDDLAALGGLAR